MTTILLIAVAAAVLTAGIAAWLLCFTPYRTEAVEEFAGSLVKTTEEFKLDPATNDFVISSRSRVMVQPTLGGQVIVRDYGLPVTGAAFPMQQPTFEGKPVARVQEPAPFVEQLRKRAAVVAGEETP